MKRVLPFIMLLATAAAAQQAHKFPRVDLTVQDFQASGYVLDIGGGGEGIIGRIKPHQVIAIDLFKRELMEAPPGPLKIVMDAADMKFLDATFNTATAFFALMYMTPEVQTKVFAETFRVLKPGGRFLIWDALVPTTLDSNTQFVAFYFNLKLPKELVRAGYATPWPTIPLDLAHYRVLAELSGFRVAAAKADEAKRTFFLELRKP